MGFFGDRFLMAKSRDKEPLLPPQDQLFRAMGLGRAKLRIVYGVMGVMAVAMVGQGVERWYNQRTLGTQVFVVVTDPDGALATAARATSAWEPGDGVWLHVAQDWLRNVRARPTDPDTWRWQASRIRAVTNRDLYVSINDWLERTKSEYRGRGVDVDIVESRLIPETVTPVSATAYVAWRERRRNERNVGDWVHCSTTVSMSKRPPEDPQEVQANPLSIWITDYNYGCAKPNAAPRQKAENQ